MYKQNTATFILATEVNVLTSTRKHPTTSDFTNIYVNEEIKKAT